MRLFPERLNGSLLVLVFMLLMLAAGCGSSHKKISTLNGSDTGGVTDSTGAPGAGADSVTAHAMNDSAAALADTVFGNPSELIEEAKAYCSEGEYEAADSTLKAAVQAIGTIDGETENGEWFPASRYIDEIVTLYKEKMPDSYVIPEEITMAVFQQQMLKSIDSMNIMPSESLSQAVLLCQKNISYDVPMVWNERVQRALFFYLRSRASTVDRWFLRANYYLPVMKRMFADSGLPQDLAYLPLIESGFNPLAYSYAHASGIWQFIASTGKAYGLKRTFWTDERRDPLKSTEAAIKYLRKLYNDFNDWHLALAAYNCGENGMARALVRNKTNDFWNLKRLPRETRNYVPFYLAALTIAKNPRCFGIAMPPVGVMPLDTVHLNDCIALEDIALGLGVEHDTLKKMNPHVLRWCTPPDSCTTLLYLPSGAKKRWTDFYAALPPEKKVRWCRYKINRGEKLDAIALRHRVTVDALKTINRLTTHTIKTGSHLFIPLSETAFDSAVAFTLPPESEIKLLDLPDYEFAGVMTRHRIRSGDNLGKIARRYHVTIAQLCRWNRITRRTILRPGRVLVVSRPRPAIETASAPAAAVATATPAAATHLVQIGDTPFSVCRKYNMTVQELASLNKLDMSHPIIRIGQVLKLSSTAAATDLPSVSDSTETRDTLTLVEASDAPVQNKVDTATVLTSAVPASPTVMAAEKPHDTAHAPVAQDTLQQGPRYHVVVSGENLYRISLKYAVSVAELMSANHIPDASLVRVGDSLLVPVKTADHAAPLSDTGPDIVYYKVKDGDTLWRIATQFGVPIDSLYKTNNLTPDTVLTPGLVIKVVKSGEL